MKTLENIGKKMPYAESPLYMESLLERCREKALAGAPAAGRRSSTPLLVSLAAACVIVFGIFLGFGKRYSASPVDKFLANCGDYEVSLIEEDPLIDEIPEYYY